MFWAHFVAINEVIKVTNAVTTITTSTTASTTTTTTITILFLSISIYSARQQQQC